MLNADLMPSAIFNLIVRRLPFQAVCVGLMAVWLGVAGCSHYRLGAGGKLAFEKLYVAPVASEVSLPQARAIVGTQLREMFLRDGRVALVNSPEAADAVLHVNLKTFAREPSVARADDTGLARKFATTLAAECTLRTRDGATLFEKRLVNVRRDSFTDSGQLQAEYQLLPLLAESLAADIAHMVLDVW